VATIHGAVSVSWRLEGDKRLEIAYQAPEGVKVEFVRNRSHEGKQVWLNGKKVD
jgi:hypothetical protein